jgi:hypothetical protein
MPDVIEELLKWSTTLRPWQRDSLRRLAASDVLTPEEENEVLRILKPNFRSFLDVRG